MQLVRRYGFERLMAERANAPFGDADLVSGRILQPFSRASHQAASNLVKKAVRAAEALVADREDLVGLPGAHRVGDFVGVIAQVFAARAPGGVAFEAAGRSTSNKGARHRIGTELGLTILRHGIALEESNLA